MWVLAALPFILVEMPTTWGVDACVPAVRRIGHPARQRSVEALLTAAYQHRAV